ncbi:MAG: hypothetical protein L0099_07305 [Acidobacteria bacterium]|nr:hypothetical protein [Acidobacteriota bacterium]
MAEEPSKRAVMALFDQDTWRVVRYVFEGVDSGALNDVRFESGGRADDGLNTLRLIGRLQHAFYELAERYGIKTQEELWPTK